MAVSRKGKRGTRASMRPSSRNRRVQVNGWMKNITKAFDDRKSGPKISKEQWVISVVNGAVGVACGRGYLAADDIASDILLNLLDAGGFNWEESEIIQFCRGRARAMVKNHLFRKEKSESELIRTDANGDEWSAIAHRSITPETQTDYCEARRAVGLLRAIPTREAEALSILCGGGNPVNVAEDMGVTPWDAIVLIKDARRFIQLVDPCYDGE